MANRNDLLGGTDWTEEGLKPTDLNDTFDKVLLSSGIIVGQGAYKTLQANNVFVNEDYIGVDEFVDSNGTNNTIDTGASTGTYDATNDLYHLGFTDEASGDSTSDPDSFTNPGNAFDSDDGTAATKAYTSESSQQTDSLGKTFSAKNVGRAKVKAQITTNNTTTMVIKLQTFNGSTWDDVSTLANVTDSSGTGVIDTEVEVNDNVEGIRVFFDSTPVGSPDFTHSLFTLEYGDYNTPRTVETNEVLTTIAAPNGLVVYFDGSYNTGGSVTVDVSDDGGSTFDITAQSTTNQAVLIDTTALTGTSIAIRFNLATSDTRYTPKIKGYSVVILN